MKTQMEDQIHNLFDADQVKVLKSRGTSDKNKVAFNSQAYSFKPHSFSI